MKVNICGIPHKVIECEDKFNKDLHFGQINYEKAEIQINKNLTDALKKEALCHEIVHGILVHIGYDEQSNDETFVQALGNAIFQAFEVKAEDEIVNLGNGVYEKRYKAESEDKE